MPMCPRTMRPRASGTPYAVLRFIPVGDDTAGWRDPANWENIGGTDSYSGVPRATDDVVFDNGGSLVWVSTGDDVECRDIFANDGGLGIWCDGPQIRARSITMASGSFFTTHPNGTSVIRITNDSVIRCDSGFPTSILMANALSLTVWDTNFTGSPATILANGGTIVVRGASQWSWNFSMDYITNCTIEFRDTSVFSADASASPDRGNVLHFYDIAQAAGTYPAYEFHDGSTFYYGASAYNTTFRDNSMMIGSGASTADFHDSSRMQDGCTAPSLVATFYDSSEVVAGCEGGDGLFRGSSLNAGTWATATFEDYATNNGHASVSASFYDSSGAGGSGSATTATFWDTSVNFGGSIDVYNFRDASANYGHCPWDTNFFNTSSNGGGGDAGMNVGHTATFNDSSVNDGICGTAVFNDTSVNNGIVTHATFSDDSNDFGSVSDTCVCNTTGVCTTIP